MIATIEPDKNKRATTTSSSSSQQEEQERSRRTLYCIGCNGNKPAEYIVKKHDGDITLCHKHWEVYAEIVLDRRSIKEEEEWT